MIPELKFPKIGDKVWSSITGEYETVIELNHNRYCILTEDSKGYQRSYTKTGYYNDHFRMPSLFNTNPFEQSKSEYPKVMMVSNNKEDWNKRVVFMKKNGMYLAWSNCATFKEAEQEVSITPWEYAKEIEPEQTVELTLEQIAKLANCDVKNLKIVKK